MKENTRSKPALLSEWSLIEHGGPAGSKCLLFPRNRIPSAGPSPGGSAMPSSQTKENTHLYSHFKNPNYGHNEDLWNPTSTHENKALSSHNLVFLLSISLTNVLFSLFFFFFYKIKSFLTHDMIVPEQALKNPAVIGSVHKH